MIQLLMQTGLEAYAAYGTPTLLSVIVLHYAGKSVVAFVGRKRANGKVPPAPTKCWLEDTNHEELLRGVIAKTRQACEIISEKGSGGNKTPLVWREPGVAEAVAGVNESIRKLDITMLRICDALDLRKIGR